MQVAAETPLISAENISLLIGLCEDIGLTGHIGIFVHPNRMKTLRALKAQSKTHSMDRHVFIRPEENMPIDQYRVSEIYKTDEGWLSVSGTEISGIG